MIHETSVVQTGTKAFLTHDTSHLHGARPRGRTDTDPGAIVGESPVLQEVLQLVGLVAPSDATVLITGETGTGKELVARALHAGSPRRLRPFVAVNCGAIPATLIASELFGHEQGAFTGAAQRRAGRFEQAAGGTLFLDEIAELPLETQTALLRVLQEHEFERVGGERTIRADVRIVAATNRDVAAEVTAGRFRADLFYRINVVPIAMPPLRDRKEDIPGLVRHFMERCARATGSAVRDMSGKSLDLLMAHGWPGNVRELQNIVERAVILAQGDLLTVDPRWLAGHDRSADAGPVAPPTFSARLNAEEKQMIEAALRETLGRVSGRYGAAARLNLPPSSLESKIRALGIDKERFMQPRAGES
jgi:transcriptional regulator with GAF, ATPase, and Fis domain